MNSVESILLIEMLKLMKYEKYFYKSVKIKVFPVLCLIIDVLPINIFLYFILYYLYTRESLAFSRNFYDLRRFENFFIGPPYSVIGIRCLHFKNMSYSLSIAILYYITLTCIQRA